MEKDPEGSKVGWLAHVICKYHLKVLPVTLVIPVPFQSDKLSYF